MHPKFTNLAVNHYFISFANTPPPPLFKFNTLPIPALHNCQILKLVHKFTHHHDKLPAIFLNYFTKYSLHVDLFASSLGQRSIKYKDSTLWNTLPEEIKAITSTVLFVNKLHKILL